MAELTSLTKGQIVALCGQHGVQTDAELARALALAGRVRRRRQAERTLVALHAEANAAGQDFAARIAAAQSAVESEAIGEDE